MVEGVIAWDRDGCSLGNRDGYKRTVLIGEQSELAAATSAGPTKGALGAATRFLALSYKPTCLGWSPDHVMATVPRVCEGKQERCCSFAAPPLICSVKISASFRTE